MMTAKTPRLAAEGESSGCRRRDGPATLADGAFANRGPILDT